MEYTVPLETSAEFTAQENKEFPGKEKAPL